MNHISFFCTGFLVLTCFFSVSCDSPPPRPSRVVTGDRPTVGIIANRTTPYWTAVEFGVNHSADKNDLHLIWQDMTQQDGFDQQQSAIYDLIARRVHGIIIASQNELLLREAINQAKDRGIRVMLMDSQPLSNAEHQVNALASVATDQYHAGQIAADEMARLLNEKGRVAVIRYSPFELKTDNREKGFLAQIPSYPDIEVVGHDLYAGTDIRRAKDKMTNFLQLYSWNKRSNLDGIFISDESTACEMLHLIEQAKYDNKIIFVAFGTDRQLVTGMLTYGVDALFMEQPVKMGLQAVDTMAELIRNQTVAPFIDSGVHCVTIDNLSSPYSQALLKPPSDHSLDILLHDFPENPNRSDAKEDAESKVQK